MLTRRIIPCLDVRGGQVTKGVQFKGNIDVGDPVELACLYNEEGADELVFYDITASNEKRGIFLDVVKEVARNIFIPFTVGGGLRSLADMRKVLLAGAEKVSIDSGAIRNPDIIREGALAFGSQCIVLSMQVKRVGVRPDIPSGYEVFIDGSRTATGKDALQWAKDGVALGAGELCINSIDGDGTKDGFEIDITREISKLEVPVIASGGCGHPDHLVEVFQKTQAEAAILASIVHSREWLIPDIKKILHNAKIPVRPISSEG